MKNIIYGVVAILLGMAFTLTVITITGVMNREIEIENALAEAVENSIEACSGRHDYSLDNNEQFVADLMIELSNAIENDSDLKIDVMGVDKDKGYMSIRVTEYYKTVIGATKTAYCETTAFLDRGSTDITSNAVTVTFIDDDNTYMGQATVPLGAYIVPPITPQKAGKTFVGWNPILEAGSSDAISGDLGVAEFDISFKANYV